MSKSNALRTKLSQQPFTLGTWCSLGSSNVVDVLGRTGLDFVIIDMEHGAVSLSTAEDMVRAAEANDIAPIIRVANDDPQLILRILETGVRTVMVPHVDTADKAKFVVASCKYFPDGKRGLSPYTRGHNYSHIAIEESLQEENQATLVGVLVEGERGLQNLEEIAEVEGVDLIYLGLFDICQSIGLPGQVEHPRVVKEIKRCASLIRDRGKIAGCMSTSESSAQLLKDSGYEFIAYLNDAAAMKAHFSEFKKNLG